MARESRQRPRVVIIGAGFGGLNAARTLRDAPVDVTLIDRHNYHTFMPLLYEVATAGLAPDDIAQPVRSIVRGLGNVRFVHAEVTGIDFASRTVSTTADDLPYDHMVIAAGTVTNDFGLEGVRDHALGLKHLPDANAVRNRILSNFERAEVEPDQQDRARVMTMVVVGGGPTGVELAGALAELRQHVLRRDHPELDMRRAPVILLEAGDDLLPSFPPRLRQRGLAQLRSLGVEVRLRALVTDVSPLGVTLRDGAFIASSNVIWVAGTRGSPLASVLGVELTRDGRVPVTDTLELAQQPGVYAIGDLAHLLAPDDRPYPMLAQVALQQADLAARNIVRSIKGEPHQAFRYRDRGTMATVGRRMAVAHVFGLQFSGSLAWLLWLAVHLLAIISLRNRALVLLNWVWNYLRYDRANRLVTNGDVPPRERSRG